MDLNESRLEWATALASTVHETGRYREIYGIVRDRVGGFPGLWRYWAEVARLCAEEERGHGSHPDNVELEDFPYAVALLVAKVANYVVRHRALPDGDQLRGIVASAIRSHRV